MVKLVNLLLYNFWVLYHYQKNKTNKKTCSGRRRWWEGGWWWRWRQEGRGRMSFPSFIVGHHCSRSLTLIMSLNPWIVFRGRCHYYSDSQIRKMSSEKQATCPDSRDCTLHHHTLAKTVMLFLGECMPTQCSLVCGCQANSPFGSWGWL